MPATLCDRWIYAVVRSAFAAALIAIPYRSHAAQVNIQGPPGSAGFGSDVAVLPNGNIVVTDPWFSTTGAFHAGAVSLYDPSGTLIGKQLAGRH